MSKREQRLRPGTAAQQQRALEHRVSRISIREPRLRRRCGAWERRALEKEPRI